MNAYLRQPLAFVHLTTVLRNDIKRSTSPQTLRRLHTYLRHLEREIGLPIIIQLTPAEEYAMARFRESTFASVRLTKSDEKKFDEWVRTENVDALQFLNRLGGDGFKFSASWVTDQNSWCFSIIGTDATKNHRNMVMTSWSDDLGEAIAIGAYKHYVVCGGNEWPTADNEQRWG